MWYLPLKHIHVTCVVLTITLFIGRGLAQLAGRDWRRIKPLRFVPHIVDTVLLASAIGLAFFLRQSPFVHHWLTAKVIALVVYIVLGAMALRPNQPRWRQATFFVAAILTFAYIAKVAVAHRPWPF